MHIYLSYSADITLTHVADKLIMYTCIYVCMYVCMYVCSIIMCAPFYVFLLGTDVLIR